MIRAFSYQPKHLITVAKPKSLKYGLPILALFVIGFMLGAGFWLTSLVERGISTALNQQTNLVVRERPVGEAAPEQEVRPAPAPLVERFRPEEIIRPVQGELVRAEGWFKHPVYGSWQYHEGYDLKVVDGETMRAVSGAMVLEVNQGYDENSLGPQGNQLILDLGTGAVAQYVFPGQVLVSPGQRVVAGAPIGLVRAGVDGALVHVAVKDNQESVNWLAILENRG